MNQRTERRAWRVGLLIVIGALSVIALAACEVMSESPVVDVTSPEPDVIPGGETAIVSYVIDGDTINVRMDGEDYRVRYVGVNTPERDEPCYDAATAANAELVAGQTVRLVRDVSDTDRYGRLLRYVYVGDVFVNEVLVRDGFAEAGYYPPDTAFTDRFDPLEREAVRAGIGCHPTGVFR